MKQHETAPKTDYLNLFKMISNPNGVQICPNHFLVGDNIALQYLGQLPHFTKMSRCPNNSKPEKDKRKRITEEEK